MITPQNSIKTLITTNKLQAQLLLISNILNNPVKLNPKTGLDKTISRIILDSSNQPFMLMVVYCRSKNVPVAQPINLGQQPKQSSTKEVPARVQMFLEAIKKMIQSTLWTKETRGIQLIHMLMIIFLKHMVQRPRIRGKIKTIRVSTVITILTVVATTYTIPKESRPQVKNLTSTALIRSLEFLVIFLNHPQKKSILILKKLARFLTQISEKKNHHLSSNHKYPTSRDQPTPK